MGQRIGLLHVKVNSSDNIKSYVPIIRKFSGDSLTAIREKILNGDYVISFDWDREDSELKNSFTSTLKSLVDVGATLSLYKDFFNEKSNDKDVKAIPLKSILTQTDMLDISEYLRTPITMKQLIKFSEDDLYNYDVYTKSKIETIDVKTVFYIDNAVEVDENDNELYSAFIQENDLCIYFLGSQAADIIDNTRYQLDNKIPNVADYIKNFNNYSKHDCYYDF